MAKTETGVKSGCFAYKAENRTCTALKELYCAKGRCGFYKSRERFAEEKVKYSQKVSAYEDALDALGA